MKSGNVNDIIKEKLIAVIQDLLTDKVNEILSDMQFPIPLIDFSNNGTDKVIIPSLTLTSCDFAEKEYAMGLCTYLLNITFDVSDMKDSELCYYVYAAAVEKAIKEDVTLGGFAKLVVFSGKKYDLLQKTLAGEKKEVLLYYQITVDEGNCL